MKLKQPVYGKKKSSTFEPDFCPVKLDSDPWIVQPTEHYEEMSMEEIIKKNKELVAKQEETDTLMIELQEALESAKNAEWEAEKLRDEAEKGKEKALEDLDLMQKRSQFELIGTIVRVALVIIIGVGIVTTIMYGLAMLSGQDTQIIGSTWSNMFGILLTNAFSIVGTIMGVKYASEKGS